MAYETVFYFFDLNCREHVLFFCEDSVFCRSLQIFKMANVKKKKKKVANPWVFLLVFKQSSFYLQYTGDVKIYLGVRIVFARLFQFEYVKPVRHVLFSCIPDFKIKVHKNILI